MSIRTKYKRHYLIDCVSSKGFSKLPIYNIVVINTAIDLLLEQVRLCNREHSLDRLCNTDYKVLLKSELDNSYVILTSDFFDVFIDGSVFGFDGYMLEYIIRNKRNRYLIDMKNSILRFTMGNAGRSISINDLRNTDKVVRWYLGE